MPETLANDSRPIAYLDAGRPVYRASACGGCLRSLVASRLGFTPVEAPEFMSRAAVEGSRHEPWVIEDLRNLGWEVDSRQEEVEVEAPAFVIRGHIDGTAAKVGERRVLEVKTMSGRRYSDYLRHGLAKFPRYSAQVAVYHHAKGLPILYAVKNRDSGALDVRALPEPPVEFEEVRRRLLLAEVHARKGALPSCDYEPKSFERRICPFSYLCDGGDSKEEAAVEGRVLDWDRLSLREWAKRYLDAKAQEDAASALKDKAREEIANRLTAAGVPKASVDGYSVSLSTRTRKWIDTARLEADFGKTLDPYRTETTYGALTVRGPKE